jgi:pyruvate/2-oxoglutarate dehydrogenase complex dihydrolipoamide dehydrogenase (E3) component
LRERPRRLLILGGGPIGAELGQAFARLGTEVVIVEGSSPLGREDEDLVAPVLDGLRADGVEIRIGAAVVRAESTADGVLLRLMGGETIEGSHLLVAAGRAPNVEELGLETAGIEYSAKGITVDKRLRTTNPAVYAAGDVTGRPAYTHAAGAHAALLIRKLLFAQRADVEKLVIPRTVYTSPALAAVGLTEAEARERHGPDVKVTTARFAKNDRAITEGAAEGFGKLITDAKGRVWASARGEASTSLSRPGFWRMAQGSSCAPWRVGSALSHPRRHEPGAGFGLLRARAVLAPDAASGFALAAVQLDRPPVRITRRHVAPARPDPPRPHRRKVGLPGGLSGRLLLLTVCSW